MKIIHEKNIYKYNKYNKYKDLRVFYIIKDTTQSYTQNITKLLQKTNKYSINLVLSNTCSMYDYDFNAASKIALNLSP